MAEILVLANETIGGEKLLDAIRDAPRAGRRALPRRRAADAPAPRQRHLRRGRARLRAGARRPRARVHARRGHRGRRRGRRRRPAQRRAWTPSPSTGSTRSSSPRCPPSSSGWLRRDLIEALESDTGLPVKHVVVDLAREGLPFDVTLVRRQPDRGGQRAGRAPEGAGRRRARGASSSSCRRTAATGARSRPRASGCSTLLASLEDAGIVAAGMIGDPDPYTAAMNAVQFFHISEIVISTLPEGTSKWVADKLVERVAKADEQAGRARRVLEP